MNNHSVSSILQKLIHIPSVTGDTKACKQIIHEAHHVLNLQKVKSKVISLHKKPILIWGELDLGKTTWLINSHLDVVPGKPSQFIPKVSKGKIWGRGSADTKSSCAIILANSKHWVSLANDKHITFMLVVDEEVGGDTTKLVLQKMPKLKGGIFFEPTNEQMIVHAKGIIQLKIIAEGKACHGSRPWGGDNALEKLTHSLTKFRLKHPTPTHETRSTTFNFSLLSGGTAINQVPESATLWCDIRWNPQDDPQTIISDLKKIFQDCKVKILKLESPINCSHRSKLCESFVLSLKTTTRYSAKYPSHSLWPSRKKSSWSKRVGE